MPTAMQENLGKYMQALMWFWVFYRTKEDGAVVLVSVHGVCCLIEQAAQGAVYVWGQRCSRDVGCCWLCFAGTAAPLGWPRWRPRPRISR